MTVESCNLSDCLKGIPGRHEWREQSSRRAAREGASCPKERPREGNPVADQRCERSRTMLMSTYTLIIEYHFLQFTNTSPQAHEEMRCASLHHWDLSGRSCQEGYPFDPSRRRKSAGGWEKPTLSSWELQRHHCLPPNARREVQLILIAATNICAVALQLCTYVLIP